MTAPLVLSLFPGIGLLDTAFEEAGFCVVRGPDLLWGGDVCRFHPPRGVFAGVIGGPPCQLFGGLANFAHRWHRQPVDLIPEFARVVDQARPNWFVMENVPAAPLPVVEAYAISSQVLNNRQFGAEQDRERRITWGIERSFVTETVRLQGRDVQEERFLDERALRRLTLRFETTDEEHPKRARTLTSAHAGRRQRMKGVIEPVSVERALELQGLPSDFFQHDAPLTAQGKKKLLAQGVPLPMGRAVARAVRAAMYPDARESAA